MTFSEFEEECRKNEAMKSQLGSEGVEKFCATVEGVPIEDCAEWQEELTGNYWENSQNICANIVNSLSGFGNKLAEAGKKALQADEDNSTKKFPGWGIALIVAGVVAGVGGAVWYGITRMKKAKANAKEKPKTELKENKISAKLNVNQGSSNTKKSYSNGLYSSGMNLKSTVNLNQSKLKPLREIEMQKKQEKFNEQDGKRAKSKRKTTKPIINNKSDNKTANNAGKGRK